MMDRPLLLLKKGPSTPNLRAAFFPTWLVWAAQISYVSRVTPRCRHYGVSEGVAEDTISVRKSATVLFRCVELAPKVCTDLSDRPACGAARQACSWPFCWNKISLQFNTSVFITSLITYFIISADLYLSVSSTLCCATLFRKFIRPSLTLNVALSKQFPFFLTCTCYSLTIALKDAYRHYTSIWTGTVMPVFLFLLMTTY